jgi:hypothetical protein
VQDIYVLFVDGENAVVKFVAAGVQNQAVETVSEGGNGHVVSVVVERDASHL